MDKFDTILKSAIAVGGATVTYLFGEWPSMFSVLIGFVVADYLTGVLASGVEGKLSSEVGFKGIAKKIGIFFLVAVAHMVDQAIGQGNVFRDATIFFYLTNELLSVIENSGRMGLPVPEVLKKAVEVLKGKGDVQ